jgi:hypothetical protein
MALRLNNEPLAPATITKPSQCVHGSFAVLFSRLFSGDA